ncbi:recombination regulator RecX [Allopusillimonas soli]|uniref:Regulatory protein RecX n=1 Tax=Allopusillimonas soli TaxID=659016 RepID=A0A853F8H3_9BURK|nr:recombination regulator RecX [Allopusillimonas soli]NYT36935.1 recombination regulator RecX [Allopusillimonas soli]TEA75389.1 recombination regulator RecX [Allopusillimonas soli]
MPKDDFETLAPVSNRAGREVVHERESARPASSAPDPTDKTAGAGQKSSSRRGLSLKARAIGYLSRREHSRQELRRKLAPHTDDADALEQLLDSLQRENWLSDARFAQSLVHRRAGRQGVRRVVQALRQHGLDDATVSQIGEVLQATEFERAQAVWQKKFGQPPTNTKEYARQYRFLGSRGFSAEVARRLLGEIPYDNV